VRPNPRSSARGRVARQLENDPHYRSECGQSPLLAAVAADGAETEPAALSALGDGLGRLARERCGRCGHSNTALFILYGESRMECTGRRDNDFNV
jgi:hypothetical protein